MIESFFALVGAIIIKGLLEFFRPSDGERKSPGKSLLETCFLILFTTLSFRFGIREGEEAIRASGLAGMPLHEAKTRLDHHFWTSMLLQLGAILGMFVAVALIYLKPAAEIAGQEADGA